MFSLDIQKLWNEGNPGYVIEHGHRQIGWIVGVITIVLAAWLVVAEPRKWLKVLGVLALVGVGLQGVLGMLRIYLESAGFGLELAMIHGIFGPLVFALLASIAVFSSRSWIEGERFDVEDSARFRRVCKLTLFMMVLQLIAGVFLRQVGLDMGLVPILVHLFFALAVIAHVMMLWVRVGRWRQTPAAVNRPVVALLALMALQVLLGAAAWAYGGGMGAVNQSLYPITLPLRIFATSHSAVGALMLAAGLVVVLRATRHLNGAATLERPSTVTLPAAGGAA